VQVDVKAERTFANALRSILRQDPDVVMIGEIRDAETAGIAVQAALTGHMVLSTLHTNDALATVHRLCDMGIAPYLLGPALRCVVGQRLVPRICPDCANRRCPSPACWPSSASIPPILPGPCAAQGLPEPAATAAARGRMAIHEVLYVSPELAARSRAARRTTRWRSWRRRPATGGCCRTDSRRRSGAGHARRRARRRARGLTGDPLVTT
jgi:type IV pilus assembly protein PilB